MIAIAIYNHTPMVTAHDFGWILISVEYTTHCYVDFGRTARTSICFGAHSNLHVLLLAEDGAITHKPICHIYMYATTLQLRRLTAPDGY